jgi:hypothetical protein
MTGLIIDAWILGPEVCNWLAWSSLQLTKHGWRGHDTPLVLAGQSFQFVSSPNRYGLPAHFELHVWAWRDNPYGPKLDLVLRCRPGGLAMMN